MNGSSASGKRGREKALRTEGSYVSLQPRNEMAEFRVPLILVTLAASLVVNDATVRLPEWPGIPPKGYNGNVAKRLPEWPGIPPKGYDGNAAKRLPEWPGIPPKGYDGEKAKRLPEWPGIPPKGYNGQVAKRLPEWPGIPPKGYDGQLTTAGIAPGAAVEDADAPYTDGAWPEASAPTSAVPSR